MKKIDLYKEVLKSGSVNEIVLRSRQVDEDNVPDLIICMCLYGFGHLCGEVRGTLVDSDLDLYESEDGTGFTIYQGNTPPLRTPQECRKSCLKSLRCPSPCNSSKTSTQ